jgi:peptidoglycan/LPS O-acetylase OafA/YrhL
MQKYPALDGLRAYVAISIIMMHVLVNITIEPAYNFLRKTISPWFTDLTLLFMVISSFPMCCSYYKNA